MILRFEVGLTVPFTNCVDRQSRCSDASRAVPGAPSTNSPTSPSCISIVAPLQGGHRQTHALPRLFTPADDCYQPSHTSWIVRTETSESVDLISRLVNSNENSLPNPGCSWSGRGGDVPDLSYYRRFGTSLVLRRRRASATVAGGVEKIRHRAPMLRRFGHVVLGRVVASDKWA